MNKHLEFRSANNSVAPPNKPLPKSMVKGKVEDNPLGILKAFEFISSLPSMNKEELDTVAAASIQMRYEDLTENRYVVNEDVDEIYLQAADFFKERGAVETTDRTPVGDDRLNVDFSMEQPLTITGDDFDEIEKIAFTYGNNFSITGVRGKLAISFTLRGYYDKQKITEE